MIVIATPSRGEVRAEYTSDLVELMRRHPKARYASALGTYLSNLREGLAEAVLASGATHLLFLDSDMRFPPTALEQLLAARKDIVGANYRQRTGPGTTARVGTEFVPLEGPGLTKVDVLGFGVTLISTKALSLIPKPWFAMPWDGAKFVGEDVYFCAKAKDAGFDIWADLKLSSSVKHIGNIEL